MLMQLQESSSPHERQIIKGYSYVNVDVLMVISKYIYNSIPAQFVSSPNEEERHIQTVNKNLNNQHMTLLQQCVTLYST